MGQYEIVALFNATPEGIEASPEQMETVERHVTANGGAITATHQWGRRRLAYEINKMREAFYTLFKIEIEPTAIKPVQDALRLESGLMRFLITVDEGGIGPVLEDEEAAADEQGGLSNGEDRE
ncbi:MAG: 30S ribosomal protein S6 [Chloroflexi bacterium]|nr:30S ribosomal protein S6 [Chloroflexota bacterium]MXW28366.1 30S ribosomal protein S6 [Chloroflexota bacterium]MXX65896.1 30S ribosomal protein S6 [Chloroflexota bacterium]MXY00170.1 30S ribosomal protein S6 [Chloroflexota bacterium]MXY13921.1 30S ribosomal protein S6 [Chloroflexota bacterium]